MVVDKQPRQRRLGDTTLLGGEGLGLKSVLGAHRLLCREKWPKLSNFGLRKAPKTRKPRQAEAPRGNQVIMPEKTVEN